MKKLLACIPIILVLFFLSGCVTSTEIMREQCDRITLNLKREEKKAFYILCWYAL